MFFVVVVVVVVFVVVWGGGERVSRTGSCTRRDGVDGHRTSLMDIALSVRCVRVCVSVRVCMFV